MKRLNTLEKILIFILLFLSVVLGVGMGVLIAFFDDTTDISSLEDFRPEIPSKIYDRNGELISELFTVKREPVNFEDLPEDLINAVLAIEDSAFYTHGGIHLKRVFGALMVNLRSRRIEQGASTITMQLARTLFTGREKTYSRKLKEIWLALKIEKKYSKNEILTLYFNQIYFGHGAYGIQAASQFYFNKPITELTLAECALLAGLPQSPNRLSPLRNPKLARKRQELILESMVAQQMVTPEEAYESFQDFWVSFRLQMRSPSQSVFKLQENRAPHFVEYVRQKLERLYGSDRIYTDGLKVYTSLDLTQQGYAETYLTNGLDRQNEIYTQTMNVVRDTFDERFIDSLDMLSLLFNLEKVNIGSHKNEERILTFLDENMLAPLDMLSFMFGNNDIKRIIDGSYLIDESAGEFQKVEGAIIAIEPKSGYITAMVGGSTFSEDNQINRAVQIRRQTGSGFKPYIYSAAIDTGLFTPASIIVDSPVIFYDGEEEWIPDNYSGTYKGKLRLREALRRSVNVVTAKIVDRLGVDTVIRYASGILGITDPAAMEERFPRVYSIALGVVELSPYEQAKGFCTFANGGKEVTPIAVLYVLDRDGNLIDNFEAELRQKEMRNGQNEILTEQTNYIITDMLRDVLRPGGTGYRAATTYEFDKPAAGKTGTTQNWKDAWFTGFTPELAACVWVGFDRNSVSLGRGQAGGVVAAPIWAQFMRDALQDKPSDWFSRPQGVYAITIDRQTGLLPTKDCKNIMTEYFLEGTIPTEYSRECGEEKGGNESFNVDIFNRKDDSSRFFESTEKEDNAFSERYDMDFDAGIQEAEPPPMENLEPDTYNGDVFPVESDSLGVDDLSVESETAVGEELSEGDFTGVTDVVDENPSAEDNADSESGVPEHNSHSDTEETIGDLG
jgi:penicillin-binding protein 1A